MGIGDAVARQLELLCRSLGPERRGIAAALEREFLPGLGLLVRRSGLPARECFEGELGLDLLHETLCELLDRGSATPAPGEVLRILGRQAYRLRLRPAVRMRRMDEAVQDLRTESASPPLLAGDDGAPAAFLSRQALLDELLEAPERHRSGAVHFERLSRRLGVSEKRIRKVAREIAAALGRNREEARFWHRRLAEALGILLRIRIEEKSPDLLPSSADPKRVRRRVRRILDTLRHAHPLPEWREGLRKARALVRRGRFLAPELRDALRGLPGDRVSLHLAEIEWARAEGRPFEALLLFEDLERALREEEESRPLAAFAARKLQQIAVARILERCRGKEAALRHLLEGRRAYRLDLLHAYNRAVLAKALGARETFGKEKVDLERAAGALWHAPPLLKERVRALLDPRARN